MGLTAPSKIKRLKNLIVKVFVFLIFLGIFCTGIIYSFDPADIIHNGLKNSDIKSLSNLMSNRININLSFPRTISGIYSKSELTGLFIEIFSSYRTEHISLLYNNPNPEDGSLFLAYKWTLNKNSDIIVIKILFTLEKRKDTYYIIRIANVEKQ